MLSLSRFVASNGRVFWGWFFLIIGSFSFVGYFYAAVVSKLQPPSDNATIRAIQNDWSVPHLRCVVSLYLVVELLVSVLQYYCFSVPLTLPILFVAVYFHWLSMKLFKHA